MLLAAETAFCNIETLILLLQELPLDSDTSLILGSTNIESHGVTV